MKTKIALLLCLLVMLIASCASPKPLYYTVTGLDGNVTVLYHERYGYCNAEGDGFGSLVVTCTKDNFQTHVQTANSFVTSFEKDQE